VLGFCLLFSCQREFRVCTISVYLPSALATRFKLKIEPSFTQCIKAMLACSKTAMMVIGSTGMPWNHRDIPEQ